MATQPHQTLLWLRNLIEKDVHKFYGRWKNKAMAVLKIFITCWLLLVELVFSKPNVLFIIVDDLRPALRCYGDENAVTPNIDQLAERSFLFENVYAQQSLCAPSRNSLLTSRRPDTLHLYDFYSYWRTVAGNYTTLPQYFKENGYHTYSIGKVFHPGISSNYTDDFPYSWSEKPFRPKTERYMNAKVCLDNEGNLVKNLICPVIVESQPEGTLPDLESLNKALRYLKTRTFSKQPFFLAVGFHKPHVPFKFPQHYLDYHPLDDITLPRNRFRPSTLPDVAWNPWSDIRLRNDIKNLNISFPFGPMPDAMTKKIIQAYSASTTYVDDLIGDLLKHVDNNTIIVLTADHGWSRGEHGEFSKFSNFEIATRVPLLFHIPRLSTNKKIVLNDLAELVDLFPTLVDLTQVAKPLETCSNDKSEILCTEGRTLVPNMVAAIKKQTSFGKSSVFTQYPRPGIFPSLHPNSDKPRLKEIKIMGYSIKTQQFRYIEWVSFNTSTFKANWKKVYSRELYDHVIDPEENINIADRRELDGVVNRLRRKLKKGWRYADS